MEQQHKRVLIVTNLPTPYKIDFYRELGRHCDLTVVIEARRLAAQKFNWNDEHIDTFRLIYLEEGYLNERKINFKVLRYLKRSYDHIIIAAYYMPTELLALLYLKAFRIPYWFESDGGMINRGESELHRRLKRFLVSGAKGYISPSAGSDEYLAYYKADPFKIYRYPFTSLSESDIIPKPLTPDEKAAMRKCLGITERNVVLAVGQFIPRKGFDILMQAAAGMDARTGFYIVGACRQMNTGKCRKHSDLAMCILRASRARRSLRRTSRLPISLFFPQGRTSGDWSLMRLWPMRCVAGMELVQDKHCIVTPEDIEGLRTAMERILGDKALAEKLAVQNLEKIRDYTIERMAETHVRILGL